MGWDGDEEQQRAGLRTAGPWVGWRDERGDCACGINGEMGQEILEIVDEASERGIGALNSLTSVGTPLPCEIS